MLSNGVVSHAFCPCPHGAQKAYREARASQDPPPELLDALIYRVTRKRIIARQLRMIEEAIELVQVGAMANEQASAIKRIQRVCIVYNFTLWRLVGVADDADVFRR